MGTRRGKVQIGFCFLFLALAHGPLSMAQDFCNDSLAIIFITDSIPQDVTTFYAQRDFIRDFTRRFVQPGTNLSMLSHEHGLQGEFTFRSVFRNVSQRDLNPSLLYARPRELVKVGSADEFFPLKMSSGSSLIVFLDVKLPYSFYLKGDRSDIPPAGDEYVRHVRHKVYEVSTQGGQGLIFNRKYSYQKWGDSLEEKDSVNFKNISDFLYNWKILYQDICRAIHVLKEGRDSIRIFNSVFCFHLLNCSIRSELSEQLEFKIFARSDKLHWMLAFRAFPANDTGNILGTAEQTCSRSDMFPLTVRNLEEASRYGKFLRAFSSDFAFMLGENKDITFIVGLARRRGSAGHMFTWLNGKALSFSYWNTGEPHGGHELGCVLWRIRKNTWDDNGWESVDCGSKADVIICHSELPQGERPLNLTYSDQTNSSYLHQKKTYKPGEIHEIFPDGHMIVSISIALSSGVLQILPKPKILSKVNGFVHEKQVNIEEENEQDFKVEMNRMFYSCENEDSNLDPGVPWSKVCDGVRDCKSGLDEWTCEEVGYPFCSDRQFTCETRQCVPQEARCDLVRDCHDGSDEQHCDKNNCPHRVCDLDRCLPKHWFHDDQVDCADGTDESSDREEPCVFICNRTQCVTREMLNDSFVDCQGPEGPLDETLGALESINCPKINGEPYLNNWAPKCILVHDAFGEILGCRDFAHLRNCSDFVCPEDYAKCPYSFCIPVSYVNDRKEDCNEGQDENLQSFPNSNLFQCHPLDDQFVPLKSVCDGKKDCSGGEDELECGQTCTSEFVCLAGAISGARVSGKRDSLDLSFIAAGTRYLDLSGIQVPDFFKRYPKGHFIHAIILNLSRCGIDDVSHQIPNICRIGPSLQDFGIVKTLDLSYNNILRVDDCSFIRTAQGLHELDLSHNERLTEIGKKAFWNLRFLKVINLSLTRITSIHEKTFRFLPKLEELNLKQTLITDFTFVLPARLLYLNVENTIITTVSKNAFNTLKVAAKQIQSSTYKICCPQVLGPYIPRHLCSFPIDEPVFACDDMITENVVRVVLWLVTPATLLGNLVALAYRLTWDRKLLLRPYGLFVTNLGICDILMGCYLVTIAAADITFKGEFVLHDHSWKKSGGCWAAGTMATISSITSTLFVALITVDRFLAVRYPYGEFRFNNWTMRAAVISAWIFGISLAVLPLLPFAQNWVIYSISGMCIGLPLSPTRLPGWQYTTSLFVVLNFLLFLFIGVGQAAIFREVRGKAKRTKKSANARSRLYQNQRRQEFAIAKQLSIVVLSNSICWFPIITLGLLALSGRDVGKSAYRWSAVVLLPINSALNPLLYTLPAIKKRFQSFKEGLLMKRALREVRSAKECKYPTMCAKKVYWSKKMRVLKLIGQVLERKKRERYFTGSEVRVLHEKISQCREVCQYHGDT